MSNCKARFRYNDKEFLYECDGADDHPPCYINLATETHAFTYLKNRGKLLNPNLCGGFLQSIVLRYVQWQWLEFGRMRTRNEILSAFPGLVESLLNDLLNELVGRQLIIGTDEIGYAPVAD